MRLASQFGRFLLVGGANTLVTFLLWIGLARVMDVRLAYTVVFALGLAFTTFASASFVFGSRATVGTAARFIGWYLAVYALGLAVVHVLEEQTGWPDSVVALVTLCMTAPMNFLGGRLAFARARQPAS